MQQKKTANVSPDFKKALEEMRQAKEENKRLKKMVNELVMDKQILGVAIEILERKEQKQREMENKTGNKTEKKTRMKTKKDKGIRQGKNKDEDKEKDKGKR